MARRCGILAGMVASALRDQRRSPGQPTMKNSHADFAQVVAGIRTGLYDLADCAATKGDRETIMKAAACLAFFESDLLIKSAGPILPGETV